MYALYQKQSIVVDFLTGEFYILTYEEAIVIYFELQSWGVYKGSYSTFKVP